MKKRFTLLVLLIALISSLSYGQESSRNPYSNNKIEGFNLPPEAKLIVKKHERIDYNYKLNGSYSNEPLEKNYLFKFTDEEFNNLKNKNHETYLYYQKANNYFMSLSDKVKAALTVEELWYIYMYDNNLKNKLPNIK